MGPGTTRREFLETTTGLVIAFALPWRADATVAPAAALPPFAPNAWLRIGADGIVTLTIDRSEMGQGSQTGLALILAEELEADWSTIRLGPMPEGSEEHTSELQSQSNIVCRLLLEKKKDASEEHAERGLPHHHSKREPTGRNPRDDAVSLYDAT